MKYRAEWRADDPAKILGRVPARVSFDEAAEICESYNVSADLYSEEGTFVGHVYEDGTWRPA